MLVIEAASKREEREADCREGQITGQTKTTNVYVHVGSDQPQLGEGS